MAQDDITCVIDNGSFQIKAGFAGDDAPNTVFRSLVGRPHHGMIMMMGMEQRGYFVGEEAFSKRGVLRLKFPVDQGIVTSWDDMEKIWYHTFYDELRIAPEEISVLHTEKPCNPKANREKTTQITFETFNIPRFYLAVDSVLSLYASGKTTGVVLDSGDRVTHSVPIYEGYCVQEAVERLDIAGNEMRSRFTKLLIESGWSIINTPSGYPLFRDMKEKLCYVALDYDHELEHSFSAPEFAPLREYYNASKVTERKQIIDNVFGNNISNLVTQYLPQSLKEDFECPTEAKKEYELPDGTIYKIGTPRFATTECLFRPDLCGSSSLGVHKLLYNSIMHESFDADIRKDLFGNIVLSGGNTMFYGLEKRIGKEIEILAPDSMTCKVAAPPERKFSSWIGGSILASMSSFEESWIAKGEYDECGPGVVHRKCW